MIENYKNKTIVFFGDSITDSCKNHNKKYPVGAGYVNMVKTEIDTYYSQLNIQIFNEGISGNKTEDLIKRFEDVKSKKPSLTFLLIGINDIWHLYDQNITPNIDEIINRIDIIVNKIKDINSEIVILTPFLFPTNEHFEGLKPLLDKLLNALYKYISKHNINYIDTYSILKSCTALDLTKDSVHPTVFGHGIIAQSIINYLTK